jgi:hypothetical protein
MEVFWKPPHGSYDDTRIGGVNGARTKCAATRSLNGRMLEKLTRSLTEDIAPLLPAGVHFNDDDAMRAFERVWRELIARIRGDAWKLTDQALDELRSKKYPNLLRG